MTDETLATLKRMRARLQDESRWTHHAFARTADDEPTIGVDPRAIKWCLLGAAGVEIGWRDSPEILAALKRAAVGCGWSSVSEANDEGGHAGAIAVLDRAIADAEAMPS